MTADWFVATGTLALAGATFWLARRAGEQLKVERQRIEAAQRPMVYPLASYEWTQGIPGSGYDISRQHVLPLKNAGPGVAVNVHGACFFQNPAIGGRTSLELEGGTIGPGDLLDARLERPLTSGGWAGATGFVVYEDVAGDEWVTHFRFGFGRGNQLVCFHEQPGLVKKLGDPRTRYQPSSD